MYTIKHVAQLTAIPEATLRAWERRYGVVHPIRSAGGYRLYDTEDVRALTMMSSLVAEGWSTRDAAAETLRRLAGRDRAAHAGARALPAPRQPTGRALRSADAEAFARAARQLDTASAMAVLDARFSLGTFERVVDDWLIPTLALVGEEWAAGGLTVAGEHLVSYAVQRRLAAAYEAASGLSSGPPVLIGLPPGAHHELGLLAFAVAARRARLNTLYVGADLPVDEWIRAVEERRAAGVVMAVPLESDVLSARTVAAALAARHPRVVVGLGGRHQDSVDPGLRLGHSIAVAAREMGRALRDHSARDHQT